MSVIWSNEKSFLISIVIEWFNLFFIFNIQIQKYNNVHCRQHLMVSSTCSYQRNISFHRSSIRIIIFYFNILIQETKKKINAQNLTRFPVASGNSYEVSISCSG